MNPYSHIAIGYISWKAIALAMHLLWFWCCCNLVKCLETNPVYCIQRIMLDARESKRCCVNTRKFSSIPLTSCCCCCCCGNFIQNPVAYEWAALTLRLAKCKPKIIKKPLGCTHEKNNLEKYENKMLWMHPTARSSPFDHVQSKGNDVSA